MICPRCHQQCTRDSVHNGIGMVYGPWGCENCYWSEDPDANKVIDGYYHDIHGGVTRVDALVEKASRFGPGIAEACREAFKQREEPREP